MTAPTQQSMAMPLNKEGVPLDPPLPESWTVDRLKNPEDLPVTLFGKLPSPSSMRVRFILNFYQVPFQTVLVKYQAIDKSYEYKKMPVMRVGKHDAVAEAHKTGDPEKGRFINDGYVMILALAKALQGREFTPEEVELEKMLTFGVQYSFIFNTIKTGKWGGAKIDKLFPSVDCGCCPKCCAKCCLGCCMPNCCCWNPCCFCCNAAKSNKIAKGGAASQNLPTYVQPHSKQSWIDMGKWFAEKLGGKDFFAGESHGLFDVDFYGIVHHNIKFVGLANASALVDADPRLKAWYDRMDKIAGHVDEFLLMDMVTAGQYKKANPAPKA